MDVAQGLSIRVSAGELIDRLAILRIKRDRLTDPARLAQLVEEVRDLEALEARILASAPGVAAVAAELREVNVLLWGHEDEIRQHERRGDFGDHFIKVARSIAQANDRRSGLKQRINELVGSRLMEAKCYSP